MAVAVAAASGGEIAVAGEEEETCGTDVPSAFLSRSALVGLANPEQYPRP